MLLRYQEEQCIKICFYWTQFQYSTAYEHLLDTDSIPFALVPNPFSPSLYAHPSNFFLIFSFFFSYSLLRLANIYNL